VDVAAAKQKQMQNISARTGKSLAELKSLVVSSGLSKHGEIVAMLKADLGLGHGDANAVALYARAASAEALSEGQSAEGWADQLYSGPKAALRPVHDAILTRVSAWGPFEIAPNKGYVSLRRKKQFAMIGPATSAAIEIGLNAKELAGGDRLKVQPPGGMCAYKVRLGSVDEVDAELAAWLKAAYDAAG
jgi:hypothetical protein